MFNKDSFLDAITRLSVQPEGDIHKEELGQILNSPTMLAALGIVIAEVAGTNNRFNTLNLTEPLGVAEAIKLQGRRDGMLFVIDILADLAEEEEETPDEI